MAATVPTALLAAWAPTIGVLIVARVLGGVAAGMAFPTTLALITALWDGPARTRSIALWSAVGGAMIAFASLARRVAAHRGLVGLGVPPLRTAGRRRPGSWPLAFVPAHVNETTDRVDHLGGVLSVVGVVALVLAINFAPSPGEGTVALAAGVVAVAALVGFVVRQRSVPEPLFDLHIAARRIFWVAAVAGLIVFGTLMGAMFVGEQFLQNVLGYSTLRAGASVVPAAVAMIAAAPGLGPAHRAVRIACDPAHRLRVPAGRLPRDAGDVDGHVGLRVVALAFVLMGIGVGLSGTPASHSLTGSVPVHRAGMASGTADLQRDLGGSIMQSILGAILTAGYAAGVAARITASGRARSPTRSPAYSSVLLERRRPGPDGSGRRRADRPWGPGIVPLRSELGLRRRGAVDRGRRRHRGHLLPVRTVTNSSSWPTTGARTGSPGPDPTTSTRPPRRGHPGPVHRRAPTGGRVQPSSVSRRPPRRRPPRHRRPPRW